MNENISKKILEHKNLFVPALFTDKQVNIMEKQLKKQSLTKTEQTYLYTTIKKKIDALQTLQEQFFVRGTGYGAGRNHPR